MTKLDQYLANAEHCRELLRAARDPRHRVYLEDMIRAWDMLAAARGAQRDRPAQRAITTGGEAPCPAA